MSKDKDQMSFLEHLEELRWRLVRSSAVIVTLGVVVFIFTSWIMEHLLLSMSKTNFVTYKMMCNYLNVCVEHININFQSTEMSGQFASNMMIAIIGGIVVSFPYIFWELWSFIKPGLKQNESKAVKGIVVYVSILFFFGILFGYFLVAPLCVQFFGNYTMSPEIKNIIRINSYLTTVVTSTFFSGLLFLLPVVIYIFTKLGVVSSAFLKKYRKHALIVVLILSAIITPPDLFSQVLVSLPVMLLYEIGILVSKRVEKKREKEALV